MDNVEQENWENNIGGPLYVPRFKPTKRKTKDMPSPQARKRVAPVKNPFDQLFECLKTHPERTQRRRDSDNRESSLLLLPLQRPCRAAVASI